MILSASEYEGYEFDRVYERMPVDEAGFVLIGPSGSGKSTLRDAVCELTRDDDESFVKYYPLTTRERRGGIEQEYRYVSEEEMEAAKQGSNVIFGNSSYGNEFLTLWPERLPLGQRYLYIYLPAAALQLKERFPNTKIVQIVPADVSLLSSRILARDPNITQQEFDRRTDAMLREMDEGSAIADAFVSNDEDIHTGAMRLRDELKRLA